MATATLIWSGEGETIIGENGSPRRRIRQVWEIPDAETRVQASGATNLPSWNQQLEANSQYRCVSRNIERDRGPFHWKATLDYDVVPPTTFDENPLNRPPVILWGKVIRSVPIAFDVDGKRILNSAGDPPDPLPTEDIEIETIRITRWEEFYNREWAREFVRKTNNNVFMFGSTLVRKGECLCASILPIEAFDMTVAAIVHMAYDFEMLVDSRNVQNTSAGTDNPGGAPFDWHLINQGRFGWFSGDKRGPILDADGVPVDRDVPLNMNGTPIDTALKIGQPSPDKTAWIPQSPIATPASYISGVNTSTLVESPFSTASMRQLLYRRRKQADFSEFNF